MPSKLVGYFLLSFLSFCFFTIIFNVLATAQVSAQQQTQLASPIPTPTIYTAPQTIMTQQSTTSTLKETPTPTITSSPEVPATATLTPQPSIAATTDLETLFSKYSAQYSVSEDELKKIANCESGFNTNSDTGIYAGMFQFSAGTWTSIRSFMGMDGNPDLRKNPDEAIKTAAFMLARGEQNAWPNCH